MISRKQYQELLERSIHIEEKINHLLEAGGGHAKMSWNGANDTIFGNTTYSQSGEDLIALNIFLILGIEAPRYLDVGAHHPFNISNTALFYERGFRGINIEANPNLYNNFVKLRSEDQNVCVGIGAKEGTLPFYMIDKWSGRNSFQKDEVELFVKEHPEFTITEVMDIPVITLDQAVEQYAGGKYPEYMSLDIEGIDYAAVKASRIFKEQGPVVLVTECEVDRGKKQIQSNMRSLMEEMGYFEYCITFSNSIYVKNEYRERLY